NAAALLVSKLAGAADFGFFIAGSLIATRLEIIPDSLATAFYPTIARAFGPAGTQAIHTVSRVALLALAVCLPVATLVMVFSGSISQILFPNNMEICGHVIRITVWSLPLAGI